MTTPALEALAEAARVEMAKIYGAVQYEENHARNLRIDALLAAYDRRSAADSDPVVVAVRDGLNDAEIVELYCVDRTLVRAARKHVMGGAA